MNVDRSIETHQPLDDDIFDIGGPRDGDQNERNGESEMSQPGQATDQVNGRE